MGSIRSKKLIVQWQRSRSSRTDELDSVGIWIVDLPLVSIRGIEQTSRARYTEKTVYSAGGTSTGYGYSGRLHF